MSAFDFNAAFATTAEAHLDALGAETVTLSRPHTFKDDRGQAITSVRVVANASIGATLVIIEPAAGGRLRGKLPAGMALATGVTVATDVDLKDGAAMATVEVAALTAALTAGTVWTLPAGASWSIPHVLPFEDRVSLVTLGQGSAGGDPDRGQQSPKLSFPATSLAPFGIEPQPGDVVTWSRGKSKILGRPKRLGDTIDAEVEVPS